MDGDVASLTRCTTGGLYRMSKNNEIAKGFEHVRCIITVEFGRTCRWPFWPRSEKWSKIQGDRILCSTYQQPIVDYPRSMLVLCNTYV